MIDIRKEYKNIIIKNESIRDALIELKEKDKKSDPSYNFKEWFTLSEEERTQKNNEIKENRETIKKLELQQDLLINNLLHIQQNLLNELMQLFLKNHKNKRIGEKTKEKIQNEFNYYINEKYDIEVYSYIKSVLDYNNNEKIEIYLSYKDFYYNYNLKNEQIIYSYNDDAFKLYYYNQANYINLNNIEKEANKIYLNYINSLKQLKQLEKKQDDVREKNNNNIPQILEAYRIKKDCYY